MSATLRRCMAATLLLLLIIPLGLAVRFVPLHLPWFFYKYLGSFLWAVALYWFVAMLLPRLHVPALTTTATICALLVEFSRLVPIAPVDAFRLTLAGKLLLGRYFSVKNIAAYLLAIAVTAWADHRFHLGRAQISN